MPRFKLTLEYDGGPFVGWQRQSNGLSVQEVIETALNALCGERVEIRGAGRTDAGVHAMGQVAHADLGKGMERVKVFRARIAQGAGTPGRVLDDGLTIACGEGALRLLVVQRAGKVPMPAGDFLRGARLSTGTLLAPNTNAAL